MKENPIMQFVPQGNPGNTGEWGYAETGEYVSELVGLQGAKIYNQMRRSDPQIAMVLRLIKNPILTTKYFIEPASPSDSDKVIADTVSKALFESIPWHRVLSHAVLMFDFGFSPLEVTWHFQNGMVVPRAIEPRLPWTITRWITDDAGCLVAVEQNDASGRLMEIPVEKLILLTTDREGDNWEGVSILRASYKPWKIKSELEKIDAIKHDRYGVGIPYFKAPDGSNDKDPSWAVAERTLRKIRSQQSGGIVIPHGWEFGIASPGSSAGTDAIASIRYHDEQIAKSILAMFASLGSTSGGNRALGEVMLSQFLDSEQSYADYIAGEFQKVVDQMVAWNWKDAVPPRLRAGKVSKVDQDSIRAMAQAGLITPDIELENYIRETTNLPRRVELAPAPVTNQATAEQKVDAVQASDKAPQTAPEHGPGCNCGKHHQPPQPKPVRLAGGRLDRELATCQKYGVEIGSIQLAIGNSQKTLAERLADIRKKQTAQIIQQYASGKKPQAVVVPFKKEMFDLAMAELDAMRQAGAESVEKEIRQQGVGSRLAQNPIPWGKVKDYDQDYLALLIDGASSKLSNMIGQIFIQSKASGLTGNDLLNEVATESALMPNASWDQIAKSTSNLGFNLGREEQASKYDDVIRVAHYSTVMEDGSGTPCEFCEATYEAQRIDPYSGELVHDLGDPSFQAPNNSCQGGRDRCRCINIYVVGE